MERKTVTGIVLILSLLGMLTLPLNVRSTASQDYDNMQTSSSGITHVVNQTSPANTTGDYYYSTIQDAVDAASSGDNIIVCPGTYYENVTVYKSLTLIGEDRSSTVINGSGFETAVSITTSDVSISDFTMTGDGTGNGIELTPSSTGGWPNVHVMNCNIDNFDLGLVVDGSGNNLIESNTISNTGEIGAAIWLKGGATTNDISDNFIIQNPWGILITSSSNNFIYNNFFDNDNDFVDSFNIFEWPYDCFGDLNIIGGPCMGGNYWSDYTGVDLYSGPYQNETGSDGIGDTPYVISGGGNQDNYPLISPFDIVIDNTTLSKTIVGTGYPLTINITSKNIGLYTETFNITAYANSTLIGTEEVTLTNKSSTSTIFTWNTTGFTRGNYTISAYATPISGELRTDDNNYTGGTVLVTIAGDVNGDRIVDIFDIGSISAHWYPGPPIGPLGYNAIADINNDLAVDIFDIGILNVNWKQTTPTP